METSAIILAGGFSKRFGQDKGLVPLVGKPLILHVLDRISEAVDEKLVVVSSENQRTAFRKLLGDRTRMVVDACDVRSPLVGALTGFKNVECQYSLLVACDTPLISTKIAMLLLDLCVNKCAAIPRWPEGYIEPLQAAYQTRPAEKAAEKALQDGRFDMRSMISNLRGVRYISTLVLRQLDPKLLTFFNVNTPLDLKRVEVCLDGGR